MVRLALLAVRLAAPPAGATTARVVDPSGALAWASALVLSVRASGDS